MVLTELCKSLEFLGRGSVEKLGACYLVREKRDQRSAVHGSDYAGGRKEG